MLSRLAIFCNSFVVPQNYEIFCKDTLWIYCVFLQFCFISSQMETENSDTLYNKIIFHIIKGFYGHKPEAYYWKAFVLRHVRFKFVSKFHIHCIESIKIS